MKTYVWTMPTRIFHIMLVVFVVGAYITSEWDDLLSIHVALGSSLGVLVLYRIVWGFTGPKYSKFSEFNLSLTALKEYMFSLFSPKKRYVGHNPAAGYTMVAILAVLLLLVLSGFLTYGIQENKGVFAYLHNSFFKDMELFEELHELLANILYLPIAAHVGGVLLDRFLHAKEGTLESIINGYKNIEGESAKLSLFQKFIALVGISLSIATLIYALGVKDNLLTSSYNKSVDYKKEHPLFVSECASCHTLYPPSLLPQRSWTILMGELEDHFGDDASLESEDTQSILAYLKKNSAEKSTSEASVKILKSLQNKDTIAITQTPFWKKRHASIDKRYFESKQVKSKANCKSCHSDVEKGLLEDENIKMPDIGS